MGDAAEQQAHWHDFGVWLQEQALERYSSTAEFAKAADINWHSVNDLFNGGRTQPDGGWRLPNPNDSTLRKIAKALGLKDEVVFKRAGGTYRQRNPDRTYPGQIPASDRDRLAALEAEVRQIRERNDELEERLRALEVSLTRLQERNAETERRLREADISIPGDEQKPARRRVPG